MACIPSLAVSARLLPVFFVLALSGCGGGGTGELQGVVTYKSKPLICGSVTVIAKDGVPRLGTIDENGNYVVPDVPCGPVKLSVSVPEPPSEAGAATYAEAPRSGKKPVSAAKPKTWSKIPAIYNDPNLSGLTTTVAPGRNSHNIDLS